jgi:type I restriction enzyme S subunit
MGLIPKGWEVKSLDELYDVGIGKTPPRKEHEWFTKSNDDVIWISIKDMGGDEVFNLDSSEKLTIKSIEKFNVKLVPSNSVIMSFKMTVGRLSITTHECATNEAIAHFKHCGKTTVSSPQLYLSLKSVNFDSYGSTSSIATAINSKIVKSIKIITPPDELNLAFAELIFPMFDKIKNNQLNSESLNKLKNKLLPKLLSGQIQIDEQKKAS